LLGNTKGQLVKKAVTRFIAREDQDVYYLHRQKLLDTRTPQVCELRMIGKGGDPFWVQLDGILVGDAAGGAPHCRVGISDVTRAQAEEEELRRARASVEEANRELQRMFAREQQYARTDALTGMNNRRYWFEVAEHEFEVAARYRLPSRWSCSTSTISSSSTTRSGTGWAIHVLERVAQVARAALRSADVIGRYGGEESVIALPVTTARQAYPVAERIRAGVAGIRVPTPKGDAAVTLSIGLTEMLLAPAADVPAGMTRSSASSIARRSNVRGETGRG